MKTENKPARQSWCFIVAPDEVGLRLDQVISARTGLGRRKVREILKLGGVQVNGRRVRVAGRMPGARADIRVALDENLGPEPVFTPEVLFEDEWMLALNKPSGIPVQGTQASDRHDFLAVARRSFGATDLHLVHRLDTGTSGVILMAKHPRLAAEVGRLFKEREVKKIYIAAVQKQMEPCTIDRPIGRLQGSRPARFACEGDLVDVRPARTKFFQDPHLFDCALSRSPYFPGSLNVLWIGVEPLTGRTHQIRVHLSAIGNPVIGDVFYGGARSSRLWLHSLCLELPHPVTKELLVIRAKWNTSERQ